MFCSKCGTQSIEGSAFCQKCGAKLIVDEATQQANAPVANKPIQPQMQAVQMDKPKKKSKKLPIILGAVALIIVAIIIVANLGDKTDYIMTVKAWKPFGSSGITATYGQVVNKFIDSATWEQNVAGQGEASVVAKGKITIDGETLDIMLAVAVSGATSDMASMKMAAGTLGGKTFSADEAKDFVSEMFIAFDEGRSGISSVKSSVKSNDTLYTTYTSEEHGFSFKYPSDWIESGPYAYDIIRFSEDNVVSFTVSEGYDLPFNLDSGDEGLIASSVNELHEFVSVSDEGINGTVMRLLVYIDETVNVLDQPFLIYTFFYFNGDMDYQIRCQFPYDEAEIYDVVFEAIMDSYTIMDAGGGTRSGAETALRLYLSHINEVRNNEGWDDTYGSMSLAYINDDDIPELIIDWSDAASGGQVLTVSNGELVSVQLSRGGGISYIERQNRFLHNNGHMDYYYDSVYTIQDGEFVRLHFGEEIGTITGNEESPYEVSYTWDGEDVSSTEYQERLNAAFDHAKAVNTWGENSFNTEEIIQIINGLLEYAPTATTGGATSSGATNAHQGDENIGWLHLDDFIWEFDSEAIGYIIGEPMFTGEDRGYVVWDYQDFSLRFDASFKATHITTDNPSILSVGGVALNMNRDGFLAALGEPQDESYDYDGEFIMTYDMGFYGIEVKMSSPDAVANKVSAWRY